VEGIGLSSFISFRALLLLEDILSLGSNGIMNEQSLIQKKAFIFLPSLRSEPGAIFE
jgi:hypothetical protein